MKKILSFLLILSLAFSTMMTFVSAADEEKIYPAEVVDYGFVIDKEGVTRLEAEDVDVTNYVISSNNPSKIVERADASNGKFLAAATGAISDNQYFEFRFTLDMDAAIVMSAAYAQTEKWKTYTEEMTKSYTYVIDGNKKVGLSSNHVLQARDDITVWETVTYDKIMLPKGEHTVRVKVAENTGRGNPNIDYIDFKVEKIYPAEVANYNFVIDREGVTRLEAEDVDVTNYVISSSNPSKIVERADASNGKFLAAATGAISSNQYFKFSFTLDMNAEIVMSAAYAQTEKWKTYTEEMIKSYTYLIDENKTVGLSSNHVLQARDDITVWETVTYDKFTLPKGEHTVLVRVAADTGRGNPNIDYIDFDVTEIKGDLPIETTVGDNDIHTALQYSYLNDENIENVYTYASGVLELSRPKAIVCDFSEDEDIEESTTYIIQKSETEDFANPITVTGLTEKKYGFYNLKLGEHFYWRGGVSLETIENSPIHEITLNDQGPRNCYVDGATNVRDIGGYKSSLVENGKIVQGLYYRGANLNSITDEGKKQLKEDLGVKVEIDLRDAYQCMGPYVEGVEYHAIPIPSGTEPTRFEEFANEYRQIFALIAEADKKPVYLHCTAGADRTGISTFMLMTVCGVSYEDMARDYLFTNFSTHGARYINSEFNNWWNKLDQFEGDTKAEKAKNWMISKGITEDQVETIREIFVEGYKESKTQDIIAPTSVKEGEKFQVTVKSNAEKIYIANEKGNKIGAKILSATGEEFTIELSIATPGESRKMSVYTSEGTYIGGFEINVEELTVESSSVSVTAPNEANRNERFNVTVVTTTDLVRNKFYNEKGNVIGSKLISSVRNNGVRTRVYDMEVATAGERTLTTGAAKATDGTEFPYRASFDITISE